ncbi:hypothetical protein QFC22_006670 [Naganishia vaughanmartiniae]|uniref:Uncharacterized protein n=1 Tax=Naganishia vaughanmartiniae TaxID=1424756 RepID=A0ACC2WGC0_9TREE|nr:hypothetical protein QFC22_006670 [Naganishia vaughanmartiniae]
MYTVSSIGFVRMGVTGMIVFKLVKVNNSQHLLAMLEKRNVLLTRIPFQKCGRTDSTYGLHFITSTSLPANTQIIACPAKLAITRETALHAFQGLGADGSDLEKLNERQLIAGYVTMHFGYGLEEIKSDASLSAYLKHEPYVTTLPTTSELLTPFQWNADELELLEGLNLGHAVKARRDLWRGEWDGVQSALRKLVEGRSSGGFSWEHYLLANTYISSRAFPSSLLDPSSSSIPINPSQLASEDDTHSTGLSVAPSALSRPANEVTPTSYPVLIPGLDTLNHRRNQAVTWVSSALPSSIVKDEATESTAEAAYRSKQERCVVLVVRTEVAANEQVFNNYGPKGNEELILGYGFSIPENPDDTLALKLGIPEDTLTQGVRDALTTLSISDSSNGAPKPESSTASPLDRTWYIPRSGELPEELFGVVRIILSMQGDATADSQDEEEASELEMDVTGMLLEMVQTKLEKLNDILERNEAVVDGNAGVVRMEVWDMLQDYVQGQMDILAACNSVLEQKMDALES